MGNHIRLFRFLAEDSKAVLEGGGKKRGKRKKKKKRGKKNSTSIIKMSNIILYKLETNHYFLLSSNWQTILTKIVLRIERK